MIRTCCGKRVLAEDNALALMLGPVSKHCLPASCQWVQTGTPTGAAWPPMTASPCKQGCLQVQAHPGRKDNCCIQLGDSPTLRPPPTLGPNRCPQGSSILDVGRGPGWPQGHVPQRRQPRPGSASRFWWLPCRGRRTRCLSTLEAKGHFSWLSAAHGLCASRALAAGSGEVPKDLQQAAMPRCIGRSDCCGVLVLEAETVITRCNECPIRPSHADCCRGRSAHQQAMPTSWSQGRGPAQLPLAQVSHM